MYTINNVAFFKEKNIRPGLAYISNAIATRRLYGAVLRYFKYYKMSSAKHSHASSANAFYRHAMQSGALVALALAASEA